MYRGILQRDPACTDALHLLGVVAHQTGRHQTAVDLIGQAANLAPENPAVHSNLGEAYRHLHRFAEAEASFQRALALKPEFPEALNNLGNVLMSQGRLADAIAYYDRAIACQPHSPHSYVNRGRAAKLLGRLDEARECYKQAVALRPDFAEACNELANVLEAMGQFKEAVEWYQRAVTLQPSLHVAHYNLAVCLAAQQKFDDAIASYRRAIALHPKFAEAHKNLANLFKDRGQLDESITCLEMALESQPHSTALLSDLILTLHYSNGEDPSAIAEPLKRWGQLVQDRPMAIHTNARIPDRPLRVGYVSADLRDHPVGWFMRPLLANHDRSSFQIYCYFGGSQPDRLTERLRSLADCWREIASLADQHVAEQIRADGIDILVDLTLHTADSRLTVFGCKPAPIQATYLAYPGSSGLETMDYRITDRYLDPDNSLAEVRSERPIRLPDTYWCYEPVVTPEPDITLPPVLDIGHITFGCLNNYCKVTPQVLDTWRRLLIEVPDARLLIHSHSGSHREHAREFFRRGGVDPDRLEFLEHAPLHEYFRRYASMDIALDTFPFPGGSTTCDALWMGVPVVSQAGSTPLTRAGLSLLSNVGLPELVGFSAAEYIGIAVALAHDLPRLTDLRRTLRDRMQRSPLMDAPRFARNMEAAYRSMWHAWCTGRHPQSRPPIQASP